MSGQPRRRVVEKGSMATASSLASREIRRGTNLVFLRMQVSSRLGLSLPPAWIGLSFHSSSFNVLQRR